MPKSEFSESDSEGKNSSEEETENETADQNGDSRNQEKISDYEKQRLTRIEENKRRMEALGLHKIANTLMGSVQKTQKKNNDKKGKKKMVDEDDEYNPTQDDDEMSSSEDEDENDEEFSPSKTNKKVKKNTSTPKKRGLVQRPTFNSDFVEDDDDLMQAIALSLQDSAGFLDARGNSPPRTAGVHLTNNAPSKSPATHTFDTATDKRKEKSPNDLGNRKRKKSITSRVQMTEDEMLIHFFQFDESGRGGFALRDIRRVAAAHDFTWSDKEMADMIYCFDSDNDGKISLEDFRRIVCRCNMLKSSDDAVSGKLGLGN